MKSRKAFVLLAGAMVMAAAVAAGAEAAPEAMDFHEPLRQRAQELAATGQPLALLAASRLALPLELSALPRPEGQANRSDGWLEQAIRTGSDQPQIARAAVKRCIVAGLCDIPAAVQTLRVREADDAVAQLLLWGMETAQGNGKAASLAWDRATRATRFTDEYAEDVALLERMTRGMRIPASDGAAQADPDAARLVMVSGLAAALRTSLVDIHRQCPAPAPADAGRSEGCRRLLALMSGSSSLLASSYGSSRMQAYALDAAERAHWQERRRTLDWISLKAVALLGPGGDAAVDLRSYLRWTGESGELGAMRQLLAAHGTPALPPADWQPAKVQ